MELTPIPHLTAMDLFCGCGGLTLGLKKAGFNVVGAVEIDRNTAETYKLNHPTVHVWNEDIVKIKTSVVLRKLRFKAGDLDLLAGCPPCQGFSTMRTLNGRKRIKDPKNDLLLEFLRFVEELRPKAVMMENVPGLAQDRRFRLFCRRLKELGYDGNFRIFNAAHFDVAQRRKRLIYLAGISGSIAFAAPSKKIKTVKDVIGKLGRPGGTGDAIHDLPERRSKAVVKLIGSIPKDGGGRTDLPIRKQLECHKKCDGFKDVYGRMAWNDVAPTITSGCFNPSKGRFLHPTQNRAITVREAALLQGFPRRYKFNVKHGKIAIALMVGNALPPPLIFAHADVIAKSLRAHYSSGQGSNKCQRISMKY